MALGHDASEGVSVATRDDGTLVVTIRPETRWMRAVILFVGLLALVASARHIGVGRGGRGKHESIVDVVISDRTDWASIAVRGVAYVTIAGFVLAVLWFAGGARVLEIDEASVRVQPRIGKVPLWAAKRFRRAELTQLRVERRAYSGTPGKTGPSVTYAIVYSKGGGDHTLLSGLGARQADYVLTGPLRTVAATSKSVSKRKR